MVAATTKTTTTHAAFKRWWNSLDGEWIPRAYATTLSGVSRQAIAKAILTKRLRVKRRLLEGPTKDDTIEIVLVNLEDLGRIGDGRSLTS